MLQWQCWVSVKETVWSAKLKIFAIWSFTERDLRPWSKLTFTSINKSCLLNISYDLNKKTLIESSDRNTEDLQQPNFVKKKLCAWVKINILTNNWYILERVEGLEILEFPSAVSEKIKDLQKNP